MRSRSTLVIVVCLLVALMAAPAGAGQAEPVGDLVKLFYDNDEATAGNQWTINADVPFHIIHGHGFLGHKRGNYQLPMSLDGSLLEPDAIRMVGPNQDFWGLTTGDNVSMQRLWNFPDGLPAGEYTVVGTWSYPCAVAVSFGFYTGECENPNDLWEQGSLTLDLTVVAALLRVEHTGPESVFVNEFFDFETVVTNIGSETATNVVLVDTLPDPGQFVSSDPAGTLVEGGERPILTIQLGDIASGDSVEVTVSWQAQPSFEGPTGELNSSVTVYADNADPASDSHGIVVYPSP